MAAANYDITIEQGSDYALALTLKDGTGAAINLTGATILAHIREAWDGPKVAQFAPVVTDATHGKVTLYLYGVNSEELSPSAAFYDVLVILAGGTRMRVVQGNLILSHAISHV